MKNRLIIANTYYQIILAIQMKLTIFKSDYVCLLISDHSRNSYEISERMGALFIFEEVHYIKTKGLIGSRNAADKIIDCITISFMKTNRYSYMLKDTINKFYDELICFNYSIDIYGLFSELYERNENFIISLYEEGILSYGVRASMNYRRQIIRTLRHLVKRKDISDSFGYFYCFYPLLYNGSFKTLSVPKIQIKSECSLILSKLFEINKKRCEYRQKYIFFTSVYDFEGGKSVGEYKLVCKIAGLVGKENILVKTHPRDTRTIYTDNGFIVDENSAIPWEAIQLSDDFSNKVFLTLNSGSVLSGSTMSEKPVRTYYMYKLCDYRENELCKKTVSDIENLLFNKEMKETLKNVKIAERLEDIL